MKIRIDVRMRCLIIRSRAAKKIGIYCCSVAVYEFRKCEERIRPGRTLGLLIHFDFHVFTVPDVRTGLAGIVLHAYEERAPIHAHFQKDGYPTCAASYLINVNIDY